jgi:hypothetical protein
MNIQYIQYEYGNHTVYTVELQYTPGNLAVRAWGSRKPCGILTKLYMLGAHYQEFPLRNISNDYLEYKYVIREFYIGGELKLVSYSLVEK